MRAKTQLDVARRPLDTMVPPTAWLIPKGSGLYAGSWDDEIEINDPDKAIRLRLNPEGMQFDASIDGAGAEGGFITWGDLDRFFELVAYHHINERVTAERGGPDGLDVVIAMQRGDRMVKLDIEVEAARQLVEDVTAAIRAVEEYEATFR